jgi:hypothetical protein
MCRWQLHAGAYGAASELGSRTWIDIYSCRAIVIISPQQTYDPEGLNHGTVNSLSSYFKTAQMHIVLEH